MRAAPPSLARRIGWRLTAVMFAAVSLGAIAVGWRALAAVQGLEDTTLQTQAESVADHLRLGSDGVPVLQLPADLAAAFRASRGANFYLVIDEAGQPILSSAPAAAQVLAGALHANGLFRVAASPAQPHGLLGYATTAGHWRVFVAQSREQVENLVRSVLAELLTRGLLLLLPIGGGAILIAVWTVKRGLRPAREASAAARVIGPARPGFRLPEADQPAEIAPLVNAMNAALSRLEAALAAQRRFVGDAAHSLRTPLAVLIARLDSLPDGIPAQELRQDADRMARLVGQMLQMARIEGGALDVSAVIDLRAVALEAITGLAPLAVQRGIDIALTGGTTAWIRGNHAALVIAVQNLVENAIKHAPPGTTVEVVLSPPVRLAVLDRGPGVPEPERSRIFGRFQRGRGRGGDGAGLGLAIVAEIATVHGGSVQVVGREHGGAGFILEFAGLDRIPALPPGNHRQDQVLPMKPARDHDAGNMDTGHDDEQMTGDMMQVIDPRHAKPRVGLRHPAAAGSDDEQRQQDDDHRAARGVVAKVSRRPSFT